MNSMSVKPRFCNFIIFIILGMFLLCFSAKVLHAQGNEVMVTTGGPRFIETMPGRTITVAFLVQNRTNRVLDLREELDMPQEWQKIVPVSAFRLSPGESTTRVLAFHVTPSTPAGNYDIEYMVRDRQIYSARDGESIKIEVLPVDDVSLMLENKPFNVIAGEKYEVLIRLVNGGNSDGSYSLKAKSSENSSVEVSPEELSLKAGESGVVTVTVQNDRNLDSKREYINIEAFSTKDGATERVDYIGVGIEIVSGTDYRADPYHFIPSRVSIFTGMNSTDDGDADFYVEWRGYGSIDEEGTKVVDFMFRGPDTSDNGGYFSERDEYYLNYYQPDLDILLGDQGYDLSDLTSRYNYGRGYGINYRPGAGDLEIGGHYVKDRDESAREQRGFHADYQARDDLSLRLNYLDRDDLYRSKIVNDKIWSLEADYELGRYGDLLVEYGISDSTRPGSDEDSAYIIEFDSSYFEDVNIFFSRIHAGTDFEGYYDGYDYNAAFIGFPLSSRLRMGLSYMDYEDIIESGEDVSAFYAETSWRAYFDYSLSNGWYLNAGYETFDRYDQLEPRDEDYSVDSVWLAVGRSLNDWSYRLETRRGEKDDHLSGETSTGWNYSVYLTHRPSESLFLTLFGEFGDEETSDIRGLSSSNRAGLSASWQVRDNWEINAWYRRSGFGSDEDRTEDEYEVESFYTFRNDHYLGLLMRYVTREDEENEREYRLVYSIPVKIKTELKKNLGTVEGRIYDAQAENNPGLSGVVLRCQGKTTVTGEDGSFILSPLVPGEHMIEIDRQSIGWERVPNMEKPLLADIKGMGEITSLDVGIVDSSVIYGRVVSNASGKAGVVDSEDGEKKGLSLVNTSGKETEKNEAGKGLPNILVELKAKEHRMRTLTNEAGEFSFKDLYPEDWVLTIYEESLPHHTYVDDPQEIYSLAPGQEIRVVKRVLPKVRNIQMLVKGDKVISVKNRD